MPAREHFYRPAQPQMTVPVPAPAIPQPAPTKAEPAKPHITREQAAEFRAAIDAARGALREDISKLYAPGESEPAEDPAIVRYREVLTGEGEPASPQELAAAARWALTQGRGEIEGN